MAEHPFMPFFPEKFFADTMHLPWDARAVYLELLVIAWNRGGSLPNDGDELRLMVGCYSKAWGRIWREIAPFWAVAEDRRLHQKRLDKEWKRAVSASRRKSKKPIRRRNPDGKKLNDSSRAGPGARARNHWEKWQQDSDDRQNPDGKKLNDSSRAGACGVPHPHIEEDSLERESSLPLSREMTRAQGILLSENWTPDEVSNSFALRQGMTESEIGREAQRFRDWHLAKDTRIANVAAAWRAWITSPHAPHNKGARNGTDRRRTITDVAREDIARMEERDRLLGYRGGQSGARDLRPVP